LLQLFSYMKDLQMIHKCDSYLVTTRVWEIDGIRFEIFCIRVWKILWYRIKVKFFKAKNIIFVMFVGITKFIET
jgi:hypothetical protein